MLQPPSITVIDYNENHNFWFTKYVTKAEKIHGSCPATWSESVEKLSNEALSWSSISWHIEDMHKRFSMCNTNPKNDLKFIWHSGHVNERVVLSSEFKGGSDSLTSFVRLGVATVGG